MDNNLNNLILAIKTEMEQKANSDMLPILQAYKGALESVRTDVAKLFIKYAIDGILSVSDAQRYSILKDVENNLMQIAKELNVIDLDHTTKILSDVYKESYYKTAYEIDKGIKPVLTYSLLTPEMIQAAVQTPIDGEMFSSRIWKNKQLLVSRVKKNVNDGIIKGYSIDRLAKDIKDSFGSTAYESKRLIHTELARVQSNASDLVYKNSNVINQVMFDATLDNKTSKICRSLDGKIFDANSNYPKPPQHPNCRSCMIPVISGWSPTKKRENVKSSDGTKKVIDYSTYDSWKKSQNIK